MATPIIEKNLILKHLHKLEPDAEFTFTPPKVTSSAGTKYYAKVGSIRDRDQYVGEAESLIAINAAAPGLAPQMFTYGVIDNAGEELSLNDQGRPFFLSEYKEFTYLTEKAAELLGKRLATELHTRKSTNGFGFGVPTYCGATKQQNGWYGTWEECYSSMIDSLLIKLKGKGRFTELCEVGEEVRNRVVPHLLRSLEIQPVLLHGDLWSGNMGMDRTTGEPVIFDPSSYYGHNEADLAIARMFGGVPKSFYSTYHTHLPKTEPVDQYELRSDLYELYHYLNHTALFGDSQGSYALSAYQKMQKLLKACP